MPRPSRTCLAAAALLGVALAAPAAPADVRAVVQVAGAAALPGVDVVQALPSLGMVVVEGPPSAVARLAQVRGVVGVAPDSPLVLTGGASAGSGVPAATGLGGQAGRPGAGAGVRIAVVDTGVSDSAALSRASGRLVDAHSSTGGAAPYTDGYGHGTFMASVAAGGPVTRGGAPVGVAPGATVLVVRVAESDGRTSLSQVLSGLEWVAAHAAQVDVASLSFSHERPGTAYGADPLTHAVEEVRDAGVTVVVSAGNAADRVGDPGFTPKALTVGAADLTSAPTVAPFSGSGVVAGVRKPDVVANGVSVLGVLPEGSVIARSGAARSGALWRGTGTSQATAVTSGAAALLLQKRPDATPAQVKAALRTAAKQLPGDRDGAGLLRVASSVRDAGPDGTTPGQGDATGEGSFDANSWSANSWSANSWSANSWSANSWSANSWSWRSGR